MKTTITQLIIVAATIISANSAYSLETVQGSNLTRICGNLNQRAKLEDCKNDNGYLVCKISSDKAFALRMGKLSWVHLAPTSSEIYSSLLNAGEAAAVCVEGYMGAKEDAFAVTKVEPASPNTK